MSPSRPIAIASTAAGGLALLLVRARWNLVEPGVFTVRWLGWDLASFGAGESPGGRAAMFAALVAGMGLGFLIARALHRRLAPPGARLRPLAVLLCAGTCFLALNPGVLTFVLQRGAESAEGYLDAEDQLHGLGTSLLVLALMALVPRARGERHAYAPSRRALLLPCLLAAIVPSWISSEVLGGQALTNDEVAYRFQAQLLADGELSAPRTAATDFFTARQVVFGERIFSKYPPAHSVVMGVGERLGDARLLIRLLAALTVFWTFGLAKRLGCREPLVAAWIVALSPLFLGVESLDLSHGTSIAFGALFLACAVRALDDDSRGRNATALLAGAAISIVFAARPVTALALALPVLVELGVRRPRRGLSLAALTFLGALPCLAAFLWLNRELTGSFLVTAYEAYAVERSATDRYGWVNRGTAASFTGFNASRLVWWQSGTSIALLLPVAGLIWGASLRRAGLVVSVPASLLFFYAFHAFHGIPWVGPLYLVEALPMLAILAAQGTAALRKAHGTPRMRAFFCGAGLSAAWLLTSHLLEARERIEVRRAPYAAAEAAGIDAGVVFVSLDDPWSVKRFPLLPPREGERLVFAVDRGARNTELLELLGTDRAWRFEPAKSPGEGRLTPLTPAARALEPEGRRP